MEYFHYLLSEEVIKHSFKVTGFYPVNKDIYSKDSLDPAKLDRFNKIQLASVSVPNLFNVFEESPDENADCVSPSSLEPKTLRVSVSQDIERETNPTVVSRGR